MKTLTPCIYHWRINRVIVPLVVLSVLQLTGIYVRNCSDMDSGYLWCKNIHAPEASSFGRTGAQRASKTLAIHLH